MSRKFWFSGLFVFGSLITAKACHWQLQRKNWKQGLIDQRRTSLELPPIPISLPLSPMEYNCRPVKLKGKFDHRQEMFMMRKYGSSTGYKVLTPFYTSQNQGFIVNRGWIPEKFKDLKSRKESFEETEIAGVLREGDIAGKLTPENSEALNEWHYMDLNHMADKCGLANEEAKKWFVQEVNWERNREVYDGEDLPELPVKTVKSDLLFFTIMPYTHSAYASFWFLSSAICAFFAFVSLKRF